MKNNQSVLVCIHTQKKVLLLQRKDNAFFWQSVTGSLENKETPKKAAVRELQEETGFDINLFSFPKPFSYEIYSYWRHRYAKNTLTNIEYLFYAFLPEEKKPHLSEHTTYKWLTFQEGLAQASAWTNREAIFKLITKEVFNGRS